jgi:hypothetical protein
MQFGPKIITEGLALNVDFSDLYFNDDSAANVVYNSDTLSGFVNFQSGTISTVKESGPFGKPAVMARVNTDNSGAGFPFFNPWHVYSNFSNSVLQSGVTYVADYFTKTTSNRQVKSQFTTNINTATYTQIGYGIHPSGEWRRILHQYTYPSGTTVPRFFIVDANDIPAGEIYNYKTKIYKFNPVNKAADDDFYYKSSFLKAAVNIDGTIEFFNGVGTSTGPEYIGFNDPYSFASMSNYFTYEVVVQIKTSSANTRIIMGKLGFNAGIVQNTSTVEFQCYNSSDVEISTSSYTVTNGSWYHLVGVFDGYNLIFYVNGSIVGSPVAVTSFRAAYAGHDLGIGGNPTSSTDWTSNCKIPFFRMYKRALTAAEIKNNFNQVKKR